MNTLELIKDSCLFGGTVPNERTEEVRTFLNNLEKQLTIPVVSVPKGTLSDFEKWLDKKENESYCGLPSLYVLEKYKSLNAL